MGERGEILEIEERRKIGNVSCENQGSQVSHLHACQVSHLHACQVRHLTGTFPAVLEADLPPIAALAILLA